MTGERGKNIRKEKEFFLSLTGKLAEEKKTEKSKQIKKNRKGRIFKKKIYWK